MIRAVLFDLDGTLADTRDYILHAYNYALSTQGYPPITPHTVAKFAGLPLDTVYRAVVPNADIPALEHAHRDFQKTRLRLVKPYRDAKPLLDQLHRRGLKLAIVTGRYRPGTERLLAYLSLRDFFPVIVCGDDEHETKPHPAPFLKAAEKLGLPPNECLVVGDGASDMESGRKAGCKTARALYGYGAVEHAEHTPDYMLQRLEDVLRVLEAEGLKPLPRQ